MFEVEAIGPMLVIVEDLRLGRASEVGEVAGVNHPKVLELAAVGERLQRELPDGLKHDEPRLTLVRFPSSDEAAADQRLESVDDVDTESAFTMSYRFHIVKGPPPSEDPEGAEERLELRIE